MGLRLPSSHALSVRSVTVRPASRAAGDRIVEAWAAGDAQALDDAWTDQIVDLGSEWGQYEYVTNVGFAA